MQCLQLGSCGLFIGDSYPQTLPSITGGVGGGSEHIPELLQEAETTIDAGDIPRLRLLDGAEEHLVETQCVSTVVLADVIGIDHVVLRLGHLLDSLADDVLSVLVQDELCIAELCCPLADFLHIQHIAADHADVGIYGIGLSALIEIEILLLGIVILLLQEVEAHELVGTTQTIDKARPTLDHPLVDELLEGLFLLADTQVEEELIPETAVD